MKQPKLSIHVQSDYWHPTNVRLRQYVWRWSVVDEDGIEVASGQNESSREDALGEAQDAVHNLTLGPY